MNLEKLRRSLTATRLAWGAAIACLGCCAAPGLALAVGFTSVAGLGIYFERAALGLGIAAAALFAYALLRQRPRACSIDCPRRDAAHKA